MKRLLSCLLFSLLTGFAACSNNQTSPTPAPTTRSGILAPADKARDTVDRLNQQQNEMENYNPGY